MSTTTHEVQAKIVFEDATTRTYAIPIDTTKIAGVKERVKELNNETGTGAQYSASMKATFVSNTGSPMTKIGGITVLSKTEEVIYSG